MERDLKDVLDNQLNRSYVPYNEVVIGSMVWESSLPHVVEAIMFTGERAPAALIHANFMQAYGLTDQNQVPLLRYSRTFGFQDATNE